MISSGRVLIGCFCLSGLVGVDHGMITARCSKGSSTDTAQASPGRVLSSVPTHDRRCGNSIEPGLQAAFGHCPPGPDSQRTPGATLGWGVSVDSFTVRAHQHSGNTAHHKREPIELARTGLLSHSATVWDARTRGTSRANRGHCRRHGRCGCTLPRAPEPRRRVLFSQRCHTLQAL